MTIPQERSQTHPTLSGTRWFAAAYLIVFGMLTALEVRRFVAALQSPAGPAAWLLYWDPETTLPFLQMLTLPVVWRWTLKRSRDSRPLRQTFRSALAAAVPGAILVFTVSLTAAWSVGSRSVEPIGQTFGQRGRTVAFSDLPPAYHDEYSYLLQARTFLDGRLSYPPMTVRPDLFHQMHVLNERRTMSRYFPWTGMWMAPFEFNGCVTQGHWLAGALAAVFFYLAVRMAQDFRTALAGGILIALSPGLAVFGNLLLSHHPTMLALSVFTLTFFRMMSTDRFRWALIAGTGLTLAMLGRPMTAAGFGLPFGLWLLIHMIRRRKWQLALGFMLPLCCGFLILARLNYEATGSTTRTAYQVYTDTYTPSHRYGFNNAVHDEPRDSRVLVSYDNWATNLTPQAAIQNVGRRLFYSAVWSLAIFPLLFGLLLAVPKLVFRRNGNLRDSSSQSMTADPCQQWGMRLLALAVISLHVVHIPYWYDGIMHWHYVFETAPLILLLAGMGFVSGGEVLASRTRRMTAIAWTTCLVAAGLLPAWWDAPMFDHTSKVSNAVGELAFSRTRFEYFHRVTASTDIQKPALILVDDRGADPQLSYVINDPELKSDVIICSRPETAAEINDLHLAFPRRAIYEFNPKSLVFTTYPLTTKSDRNRQPE